jgi:hypothetical protein
MAVPDHVGFMVHKVELVQAILRVLRIALVSVIPPWLSIAVFHLVDEQ